MRMEEAMAALANPNNTVDVRAVTSSNTARGDGGDDKSVERPGVYKKVSLG